MADIQFPQKLEFLFEPCRYKVAYGGRGSGKSWSFARALLVMAASKPLRILCTREVQKSIKDSVHKLLSDQIQSMQLGAFFEVLETEIRGKNGSEFLFAGLANHTVESIKSYEGVDIVWVEEAQRVSKRSWTILIPTIRKDASEIWVSFNPELDTDETYQRFVIDPPTGAKVVKVNWDDNPWFPAVLEAERLECRQRSPKDYRNIWEGECKDVADGAIYADEVEAAKEGGRITRVPYDPMLPVHTAWDLGVLDATAVWFWQQTLGGEIRLIDYFEASGQPISAYVGMLSARGYVYGSHYAPHDIQVRELGTGKSRLEVALGLGLRFEVTPNIGVEDGISAVQMLFPRLWFDEKKCADGLRAVKNYRRDYSAKLDEFRAVPVHDWASHGADALRYLAVNVREITAKRKPRRSHVGAGGWMG